MKLYVENLQEDNENLESKIKKKSKELQRCEKRLKSLTNVRPPFMAEYERSEKELEMLYNIYLEKFRNLDYLEN
jgi:clusterin-associated protein 1